MSQDNEAPKPPAGAPGLTELPLSAAGVIRLFGCAVAGITLAAGALGGRLGALAAPRLAWIYGFAFEGHYYDLAKPTIFVVEGDGEPSGDTLATTGLVGTGSPATAPELHGDVRCWPVDRDDLGVRLDVETGSFQRLLLDAELRGERVGETYSGATVRMTSGATVRVSGGARFMGGDPRRVD